MDERVDENGNETWYRKKELSSCEESRRLVVKLTAEIILLENNLSADDFRKEWKSKIEGWKSKSKVKIK